MKVLVFAKNKFDSLIGRDVDYSIPDSAKKEDFQFREIEGKRYLTVIKDKTIAQKIIYPEANEQSIWHDQAVRKLIGAVEKMFDERSYFDVCVVDSAIRDFNLSSTPSVEKALEELNIIHCVHYSEMLPEVFEAIPRYMTHIFTEGRVPLGVVSLDGESHTAKPIQTNESQLLRELSDLANDAIAAFAIGTASQDTLEALRERQRQALNKMLGEEL